MLLVNDLMVQAADLAVLALARRILMLVTCRHDCYVVLHQLLPRATSPGTRASLVDAAAARRVEIGPGDPDGLNITATVVRDDGPLAVRVMGPDRTILGAGRVLVAKDGDESRLYLCGAMRWRDRISVAYAAQALEDEHGA
jgi:hypothetical protein